MTGRTAEIGIVIKSCCNGVELVQQFFFRECKRICPCFGQGKLDQTEVRSGFLWTQSKKY